MNQSTLRIASRKSDLARVQAYTVARRLKAAHPNLQIQFLFRESLGDINLSDPLWKMPERGVFTQDFYQDLVDNKFDLVVHSWKDLPIEERNGTSIYGTLERADSRDLLLVKKTSWKNKHSIQNLNILTSSPRRIYNLQNCLADLLPAKFQNISFTSIRGNVPTRLQKFIQDDSAHGFVLAKAGLDRLLSAPEEEFRPMQSQIRAVLEQCLWMVLPFTLNPCAAAQGALALELRQSDNTTKAILNPILCQNTYRSVTNERKILSSYGGGCHQKIGVQDLSLHEHFSFLSIRGLTDQNEELKTCSIISKTPALNIRVPEAACWDSSSLESQREELNPTQPTSSKTNVYFISRSNAWPQHWRQHEHDILWTAGIESWKKLAQQGLWVNGSQENLGESLDLQLDSLVNSNQGVRYIKLSHDASHRYSSNTNEEGRQWELLPTYKISIHSESIQHHLEGKEHFYWSSASQFDYIFTHYPDSIKKAKSHACGPGLTYTYIHKLIANEGTPLLVFLNRNAWQKALVGA